MCTTTSRNQSTIEMHPNLQLAPLKNMLQISVPRIWICSLFSHITTRYPVQVTLCQGIDIDCNDIHLSNNSNTDWAPLGFRVNKNLVFYPQSVHKVQRSQCRSLLQQLSAFKGAFRCKLPPFIKWSNVAVSLQLISMINTVQAWNKADNHLRIKWYSQARVHSCNI